MGIKMGPSYANLLSKQFPGHGQALILRYIFRFATYYFFLLHISPRPRLYMKYRTPRLKHNPFGHVT